METTTYHIKQYPIKNFHGVNKYTVPVGSTVAGAVAIVAKPEVVFALIVEPVPKKGKELEVEMEEIHLVSIAEDGVFSSPAPGKVLEYVNTVIWDNGHRVNHIFWLTDEQPEEFEVEVFEDAEVNDTVVNNMVAQLSQPPVIAEEAGETEE